MLFTNFTSIKVFYITAHSSKSYELIKYTLHKRDYVEHRYPEKENFKYQNLNHRVYHKFLRKQNH